MSSTPLRPGAVAIPAVAAAALYANPSFARRHEEEVRLRAMERARATDFKTLTDFKTSKAEPTSAD